VLNCNRYCCCISLVCCKCHFWQIIVLFHSPILLCCHLRQELILFCQEMGFAGRNTLLEMSCLKNYNWLSHVGSITGVDMWKRSFCHLNPSCKIPVLLSQYRLRRMYGLTSIVRFQNAKLPNQTIPGPLGGQMGSLEATLSAVICSSAAKYLASVTDLIHKLVAILDRNNWQAITIMEYGVHTI